MLKVGPFLLIAILLLAHPASGQQSVFIGVGVDRYDNAAVAATPYCVNDVNLLAKVLTDKQRGTFKKIVLLHSQQRSPYDQPTKANIERELVSNLRNLNNGDTVVFFFAGHGYIDGKGRGFLIAKDTDPANLEATAISTKSIRELLSATDASKVCILDCCHAAARGLVPRPNLKAATGKELGDDFSKLKNVLTIASCDADQKSHPLQAEQQGLFTYTLAKALVNDDLDQNADGFLEAAEVFVTVRDQVRARAKKMLAEEQIPALITLGKLPDIRFTKVIGGTAPFASDFDKEQNGLVPEGWKGSMIVQQGKLVPNGGVDRPYWVALPPQQIRDGFELNLVVDYISVGRFGTSPVGALQLTLADKGANPWRVMFQRGYVTYRGAGGQLVKKDIDDLLEGNKQTTARITATRKVTKRGATISVAVDGTEVFAHQFHGGHLSDVKIEVVNNRLRTPEIHSVSISPLKTLDVDR